MIAFFKQNLDVFGEWVDDNNNPSPTPSIARGVSQELNIVFLDGAGRNSIDLSKYSQFLFRLADDYNESTPVKLAVEANQIVAQDYTCLRYQTTACSMLSIKINPNSDELVAALGSEEKIKLIFEITGFVKGGTVPDFVAQGNIYVRNRISFDVPATDETTTAILSTGVVGKAILGKE